MGPDIIILIIVLIASIVVHEVAHGYAALKLGDPTAKLQGRLTLNPIVHMDPVGSVLVPGILALSAVAMPGAPAFLFGWARPVPYNPYNFTDQKYGEAKVAAAGPAANLLIAVVFGVLLQTSGLLGLPAEFVNIAYQVIAINVLLMIFNLFPIPPLDGSKILPAFLPFELRMKYQHLRNLLESNPGLAFLVLFGLIIFVLQGPLVYLTALVTNLLAGF